MCTVTVIALEGAGGVPGVRLVTNRDERRGRPEALPPVWHEGGDRRMVWPVDPLETMGEADWEGIGDRWGKVGGGGTWVGASDRGFILTLLNHQPPESVPVPGDVISRGTIITRVIDSDDAEHAMERAAELDLERFAPFRLISADITDYGDGPTVRVAELGWDRREMYIETSKPPKCFVSSGLGDHVVEPRLRMFDEIVGRSGESPGASEQDAFHDRREAPSPELAIRMSRPEARTVSRTAVTLLPAGDRWAVEMGYEALTDEVLADEGR